MCITIVSLPDCDVINFVPYLSNQAVFLYGEKVKTKVKYFENEKSFKLK